MHNIRASLALLVLQKALFVCAAILFIVSADSVLHAQRPTYTIEVTLDTVTHELSGFVDMTYTNTSPGPLDSLAIHLWANAYANKNTTFAKQLLHLGTLNFNNAKPEEMGGYKNYFSLLLTIPLNFILTLITLISAGLFHHILWRQAKPFISQPLSYCKYQFRFQE